MTITHQVPGTFSAIFGISFSTVTATATAAYQPRDVAIVLDYSGSMNNESDIWNCESYLGSMENTPNDTNPVFPQFGPYNPTFSANATSAVYQHRQPRRHVQRDPVGAGHSRPWPTISTRTTAAPARFPPSRPPRRCAMSPRVGRQLPQASGVCVLTWSNAVNPNSSFFPGYPNFNGYTQGPGYWGKTFFIWPPQPTQRLAEAVLRAHQRLAAERQHPLWNSSGIWQNPAGNYIINYKAILNWIKNIGPNPFPSQLRAGNILYYSSIPSDVPAAAYDPTQPNSNINGADGGTTDQRFWKEYIDYVIGVWHGSQWECPESRHADVQLSARTSRRATDKPSRSPAPTTCTSRPTRPSSTRTTTRNGLGTASGLAP